MPVFLDDADRRRYLELLQENAERYGLSVQAYCVMTNHVHIVGVPAARDSMYRALHRCHGMYASEFNVKYQKAGHVWQARFYSCALDDAHFWAAMRYVERNPVRAGMVERAEDYRWSSAAFHCGRAADPVVMRNNQPQGMQPEQWRRWLAGENESNLDERIRERTGTGRPCGDDGFLKMAEHLTGRRLAPTKPGPKPRERGGPS